MQVGIWEAGPAYKRICCLPMVTSHRLVLWVGAIPHVGPVQSRGKIAINGEVLDGNLLADRPIIALKPSIWFAANPCEPCPVSDAILILRLQAAVHFG